MYFVEPAQEVFTLRDLCREIHIDRVNQSGLMIRLCRICISECEAFQILSCLFIIILPCIVILQHGIADEIDRAVWLLCCKAECGEGTARFTEIIGFHRHTDGIRLEVNRRLILGNRRAALHPRNIRDMVGGILRNIRREAERFSDHRRLDAADCKRIVIPDHGDCFGELGAVRPADRDDRLSGLSAEPDQPVMTE